MNNCEDLSINIVLLLFYFSGQRSNLSRGNSLRRSSPTPSGNSDVRVASALRTLLSRSEMELGFDNFVCQDAFFSIYPSFRRFISLPLFGQSV